MPKDETILWWGNPEKEDVKTLLGDMKKAGIEVKHVRYCTDEPVLFHLNRFIVGLYNVRQFLFNGDAMLD